MVGAGIFGRILGAGTDACLGAMFGSHGLSGLEGVTTAVLAPPGGPGILAADLCIAPGFPVIGVGGCGCLCGSGSNVISSGLPFAATPKSASSKRSPVTVSHIQKRSVVSFAYFQILRHHQMYWSLWVSPAFLSQLDEEEDHHRLGEKA